MGTATRTALICAAMVAFAPTVDAASRGPRKSETAILTPAAFAATRTPSPGPARSIGGYAAGCVAGAKALAPEGAGYQVIRLSRDRNWGHPTLVDMLSDLGTRVQAARLGTMLVGDMGQPRGGPLPSGHASHTIGLDADIWLRLDLPPMDRAARERLSEVVYVDYDRARVKSAWSDRQANLVRLAAVDPRVERIFVHPTIKHALCEADRSDRAWLRKVRPWWGHDGHMHVRLSCPAGSPSCERQKPLPEGDGCDDLSGWIAEADRPVVEQPRNERRAVKLPAACRAVLNTRETTRADIDSADVFMNGASEPTSP